jgi:hypothetical protein
MTLYAGQTAVKITLDGLGNLSDASSAVIKYKKPDGSESSWNAVIDNIEQGVISYDLTSADEVTAGDMTVWAYVVFSDGRIGIGDPVKITVRREGSTR